MNEILLFMQGLVAAAFVMLAWRLDRERLYAVMVIFLILISVTGGKIVEFLGHATNTGNVLYAAVFLATYFLIERYGRREGFHSIWVGLVAMIFFMTLARISVMFQGSETSAAFNDALTGALSPSYRIAFASLIAYTCSQSLNVALYVYMKTHMRHIGLWLRANTANLFAQIIDSLLFFSIAFWGSGQDVSEIMLTGIVIKVLFMAGASLLLYFNGFEEHSGTEYTSVTWRS